MRFAAALLAAAALAAQAGPVNLGFEEGEPGQTPAGWRGSPSSGYRVTLTSHDAKSGRYCAEIASTGPAAPGAGGGLEQSFDATPYRGKRVRFRAAVRAAVSFGTGSQAQAWLRVDRTGRQRGYSDFMVDRPIRSAGWQHYEIVADVDEDGETLNIGVSLAG